MSERKTEQTFTVGDRVRNEWREGAEVVKVHPEHGTIGVYWDDSHVEGDAPSTYWAGAFRLETEEDHRGDEEKTRREQERASREEGLTLRMKLALYEAGIDTNKPTRIIAAGNEVTIATEDGHKYKVTVEEWE